MDRTNVAFCAVTPNQGPVSDYPLNRRVETRMNPVAKLDGARVGPQNISPVGALATLTQNCLSVVASFIVVKEELDGSTSFFD